MDNSTNGYSTVSVPYQFISVSMSSSGQYQVVTVNGSGSNSFYSSNNYGASWTLTGPSGIFFTGISLSASGQYQTAVQQTGSIYTSNNFGASWSQYTDSNFPTSNNYSGISVSASGKYQSSVVTTGSSSPYTASIVTSSNFGGNWTATGTTWSVSATAATRIVISATGQFQTAVSPDTTNTFCICYISSNYGGTWSLVQVLPFAISNLFIVNVAMSASGQYQTIVLGTGTPNSRIFNSSNYGVTWTQGYNINNYSCGVTISASGQYQALILVTSFVSIAEIYLSMDYGNTWTNTYSYSTSTYLLWFPSIAISSSGQYITSVVTTYSGGIISKREILMPAKTFIIDHPRDSSKHLIHACIEGPEAGVYYRGRGEIINNKSTEIILPEYVESLAKDFTIEVTHIYDGTPPKSYSVSEILYGRFTVYGVNGSFYWQVTGVRSNIIVEPDKDETNVRGNTDGPYLWIE
jgi:hypothetical protein